MSRWKPIDTYRPGVDPEKILVTDENGWEFATWRDGMFDLGWGVAYEATHWQPLPPLPGEDGPLLEWEKEGKFMKATSLTKNPLTLTADKKGLEIWENGDWVEIPTPNQAAAMTLAQGISDLIRAAQEEGNK